LFFKNTTLLEHPHYISRVAIYFIVELALIGFVDFGQTWILLIVIFFLEVGVCPYISLLHLK